MSFPSFKDLDKAPADLIADDFDSKFTLKIKSAGPNGTTITTTTEYTDKDNKQALKPKVALKWPHDSGFTLEKLEFSPDFRMAVETSLTGAAPGLKLEFKGNDSEKAEVSCKYTHPVATLTGALDINNFSTADVSVCSGHGPFTGGVALKFTSTKDDANKLDCGVGVSHTVPGVCFSALRAKENFNSYSLLFSYSHLKDAEFAGSVNYSPKGVLGTLVGSYAFGPKTVLKGKANSDGVLSASVKQNFDKKFAVVASAEVPSNFNSIKWGINATLG